MIESIQAIKNVLKTVEGVGFLPTYQKIIDRIVVINKGAIIWLIKGLATVKKRILAFEK